MRIDTSALPPQLADEASRAWSNILDCADAACADDLTGRLGSDTALAAQAARVLATSPFVAEQLRRRPQILQNLLHSGELHHPLTAVDMAQQLQQRLAAADADLGIELRRYRQQQMVRIIWRDFCRLADTRQTVAEVSALAEASIQTALAHTQANLEQRFGRPMGGDSGEPQQLIVLAMGKLGAGELNLSSDIDLIFVYPEAGYTDSETRPISNEEFFTKVGQGLIAALDQLSAEGFVFRVDMRLRPYGDSGALVHNFAALEEYYQDQGRDWERYALIKARPVTGDAAAAAQLMQDLKPFVFRRYIDFGVIESLRGMKQMISSQVRRRGLQQDVKLGPGGIREIEFIGQCFQLIRGGRDLGLQRREILLVLDECAELGCLPVAAVAELKAAYCFLRDSEHAIQGFQDKQTQALPDDPYPQLAMATAMGFDNWEQYMAALDAHRQRVQGHFAELIAPPEEEAESDKPVLPLGDEGIAAEELEPLGFVDAAASSDYLNELIGSAKVRTLQAQGKERLEQFLPQLLQACAAMEQPDRALERVLPLVAAVLRRSAYLALLLENPTALTELVKLCAASPWIADQIASRPVLLDELLDTSSLYSAPDKSLLQAELRQQVARLAVDDLEAQMDALRYFKAAHVLRVAASETSARLPVMQVSDKLTWIAEAILEQVLAVAWADLTKKYGQPEGEGSGFAIFGYGKLGGIELGYSSDLDLVFVWDGQRRGATDGQRSIANDVFYTRLGQRMIHILETRMALGQLYEVDMRLRPAGESGLLVTTAEGFAKYQQESAWTWEHQALVRARYVAGDKVLAQQLEQVREAIICQPRDEAQLAAEVVKMRARMREHLLPGGQSENGEFHLKQGPGGIVDIEFMVQYAVLAWSHRVPALAQWSDNVRILQTLAEHGLFSEAQSAALTAAYLAYRAAAHQLALQQQPSVVDASRFGAEQQAVIAKWQQLFADVNLETDEDKMGE